MTRLPVAITMGDPAGVGPEIALKAWANLRKEVPMFLIGDIEHMSALATTNNIPLRRISTPDETVNYCASALPVLHSPLSAPVRPGVSDPQNASAVIEFIRVAVAYAQDGQASSVVTNPINKKMLHDGAGFSFPGHTEFLAHLGNVKRPVMMLVAPGIRVVPVTIHIALADVAASLTPELLRETIKVTHNALTTDFGIARPRITVAGLNPHAGEGGNMGSEEIDWINAEIEEFRNKGLLITGPQPADTMFHPKARETYDAAICMYHDQALIPIKTIDFANGVNVTLGLPFVRTSPDHGTAYDIAGTGSADASSLIAALRLAADMAERREMFP